MKRSIVLISLLLAGCATANSAQDVANAVNWTAIVKPLDPVPTECTQAPPAEPKPVANKPYDAKDSARHARKLLLWGRAVRSYHNRCRKWAKAQR